MKRLALSKLQGFKDALTTVGWARERGESVAFTNGCFDLLHAGHLHCLEVAAAQADRLVVAVNTDFSYRHIRGRPPIIGDFDRMKMVAALECVDWVVPLRGPDPFPLIAVIEPDVIVKGADWKLEDIVGRDQMERRGGRVVIASEAPGCRRTSEIIRRIRERG